MKINTMMKKLNGHWFLYLALFVATPGLTMAQHPGVGALKVTETSTPEADSVSLEIGLSFNTLSNMKGLELEIERGKGELITVQADLVYKERKTFLVLNDDSLSVELVRYTGIIPLTFKRTTTAGWKSVQAVVEEEDGTLSTEKIIINE